MSKGLARYIEVVHYLALKSTQRVHNSSFFIQIFFKSKFRLLKCIVNYPGSRWDEGHKHILKVPSLLPLRQTTRENQCMSHQNIPSVHRCEDRLLKPDGINVPARRQDPRCKASGRRRRRWRDESILSARARLTCTCSRSSSVITDRLYISWICKSREVNHLQRTVYRRLSCSTGKPEAIIALPEGKLWIRISIKRQTPLWPEETAERFNCVKHCNVKHNFVYVSVQL